MQEIKLFLKQYFIGELNLKLNPNFKKTNELISINPIFSRKIEKVDDDNAIVFI